MSAPQRRVLGKRCEICERSFARNEHLIRHRRIHTGERPFDCPHCNVGFPRADVREKHMKKFHPEDGPASETVSRQPDGRLRPSQTERSRLACDQCRKRKLKCNNTRPCESCRSKLLPCTVSSSSRPPGRPRHIVPISPDNRPNDEIETNGTSDSEPALIPESLSPNSIEPSLVTPSLMPSIDESRVLEAAGSVHTYPSMGDLSPPGTDQEMTSEAAIHSSIEALFPTGPIQMDHIWNEMEMMKDLLPQPCLGNWVDDLNDVSVMDDMWPLNPLTFDIDSSSSVDNAVDIMKDYIQRRSRAPSPSREEQKRSWYSVPPQLDIYDKDVVNVLLNLARTHISSTFTIFNDFEVNHNTRVELYLAMAAVGGLYCTAHASIKVAKKLYNDSRRLLLEAYLQSTSPAFDESLSFAKTFILLEMYGLCTGDKRAYEFIEVFHASKLHATSSCLNVLSQDSASEKCRLAKLLSEAVRVLDCYRVLLLQRPPSFTVECPLSTQTSDGMHKFQRLSTGGLISTPNPNSQMSIPTADMHHLATIICYSWMAGPQDLESSPYPPLWKHELVELALNQWIQDKTSRIATPCSLEIPQMLLFHLTQVALHANLRYVQRFTQGAAKTTIPSQMEEAMELVQAWRNSPHASKAQWHANAILHIVQEGMSPPRRYRSTEKDRPRFVEPPHLPFCIYFATLIIWYGQVVPGGDPCSGDSAIETGSQLLFGLKVPVAQQLGTALCELLSSEAQDEP
ncbi:hypothetical protein F5884DRAFT_172896 [Xylogone sp. PMI_703]|nr:hypothetical protein F5884DRAFT_172896 [Xylogone sp. PMI_703]